MSGRTTTGSTIPDLTIRETRNAHDPGPGQRPVRVARPAVTAAGTHGDGREPVRGRSSAGGRRRARAARDQRRARPGGRDVARLRPDDTAARRGEPARTPTASARSASSAPAAGLRISFAKQTRNAVTVEVFQTSKGRKIVNNKRVARFRNRQRSFTWNGRKTSGKKARVARGVYFVRFRVTDDAKKVDTRRVVVAKRNNGRFYKQGKFVLETHCPQRAAAHRNDVERPPSGGRSRVPGVCVISRRSSLECAAIRGGALWRARPPSAHFIGGGDMRRRSGVTLAVAWPPSRSPRRRTPPSRR